MNDRQTGRTTQQMLDAPIGAVYVWCNSALTYPKVLAHRLQRDDLSVKPLAWLTLENICGHRFAGVVVDHAARIDIRARDALRYLQARGIIVSDTFP